jgi:predicted DNA-binding transcriptional regulator YafY
MAKALAELPNRRGHDTGEASESVARKIWLLLELLRSRSVRYSEYVALHGRDKRSFQRDLQQLRAIGTASGFRISKIEGGETARLTSFDAAPRRLDDARPPMLRLLAELARTLGEPIRGELGALVENAPDGDVFLHVQAPQLVEGSHAERVYRKLKDAWASPNGRALVRFRYVGAKGKPEERTIDPHRVVVRSGRYFLIGYDQARRGWRRFALDAIVGMPAKAGTAHTTRTIPDEYCGGDVLGFISTAGRRIPVTVEFSSAVAASAASRIWQAEQKIEKVAHGAVRITIAVGDVTEAVRWAFGFGADARIVAPPSAVAAARGLAERLVAGHAAS